MSRMLDRLYAHGMRGRSHDFPEGQHFTTSTMGDAFTGGPLLENPTAFVIDNVTEYLFANNEQEHWSFEDDFPCVMLPFPELWMETRRPSRIVSIEHAPQDSRHLPLSWGVLLKAEPFAEMEMPTREQLLTAMGKSLEQLTPTLMQTMQRSQALGRQLTWDELSEDERLAIQVAHQLSQVQVLSPDEFKLPMTPQGIARGLKGRIPRWKVHGFLFLEWQKTQLLGPALAISFYVDGVGKVIPVTMPDGNPRHLMFVSFLPLSLEEQRCLDDAFYGMLCQFWLALSFCHCKNVEIPTTQHVQHGKPQRYHGRPRVTYHTLNIQPMRRVLRQEGKSETTGLKQALSICRGHFKDYAQGKGLFGKLHGLYWWEQHLRGHAQHGIHLHDYAVQPPA